MIRRCITLLSALALACALPVVPLRAQVQGPIYCGFSVISGAISTSTTTSLIAVPSGTARTYICGYTLYAGATASAMTLQLEYGTGATCTGPTVITPAIPVAASTLVGDNSSNHRGLTVPPNNGLCVVSAGTTVAATVQVFYAQQ